MNMLDDIPLAQESHAYGDIIGQPPNALKLGNITLRSGVGAPSDSMGANGDFYFRSNGGAGTYIYFKAAGSWSGIV